MVRPDFREMEGKTEQLVFAHMHERRPAVRAPPGNQTPMVASMGRLNGRQPLPWPRGLHVSRQCGQRSTVVWHGPERILRTRRSSLPRLSSEAGMRTIPR